MKCQWNANGITGEECDREVSGSVLMCSACENLRQRWFKVLQEEDKSRFTRKQLLNIIDTHKSLSACRQILRIMQQHRVVHDDSSDDDSRSYTRRTPSAATTPSPPPSKEPLKSPASAPATLAAKTGALSSASSNTSPASLQTPSPSTSPPLRPLSAHDHHIRRTLIAERKQEEARAARASKRSEMAAQRLAESRSRELPVPPEFTILEEATKKPSPCREMEAGAISWDETESLVCWKCGQTTEAERSNVVPLIIGDKDHLYRALPLTGYGAVVCVPTLLCAGKVQSCSVGFSRTMSYFWWNKKWVSCPDFLKIPNAGQRCIEVPRRLCQERAIVHVLHWFSKTKEARDDDHAGFPPPGIKRGAAIVYREDEAAGYCTFTTELIEEDEGWRLPTFYNIFVRQACRRMGCARQLLEFYFRPQLLGKTRRRTVLRPQIINDEDGKPRGTKFEEQELILPPGIDTPGLDFLDMLHIDPPVSKALVAAMGKIFTPTEMANIVCDSGHLESGSLTYLIDPADPKTRVFRPSAASYIRFERPKGEPLQIGGIFSASSAESSPAPPSSPPLNTTPLFPSPSIPPPQ